MNTFKTSLVSACVFGMFVATASAQVRLFMAADGEQSTVATSGNTHVTMFPGTSKKIMVWLEDTVQSEGLDFYQVVIPWRATPQPGAAGSVSYVDNPGNGDSFLIELGRGDYVFFSGPRQPSYIEIPPPPETESVFGCISSSTWDFGGPLVFGVKYLGEFTLHAFNGASGAFELSFIPFGQHSGTGGTVLGNDGETYFVDEMQSLLVSVVSAECPGNSVSECCDLDQDGARDDPCVWCDCAAAPLCAFQGTPFADVGGAFAECIPDGFCNIHDRNHALTCFSGDNPCEDLNIDAGGAFGACAPDGFCNVHDANHALACFAGMSACGCPTGPSPEATPVTVAAARLHVVPDTRTVAAGSEVSVRVFGEWSAVGDKPSVSERRVEPALPALQSYQLHLGVSGGQRGTLELVEVSVEPRRDYVFAGRGDVFDAFNVGTGQMLAGIDGADGVTGSGGYLATYTYCVTGDAVGTFVVDALYNEDAGDQTFLIAPFNDKIDVAETRPAVVIVRSARSGALR